MGEKGREMSVKQSPDCPFLAFLSGPLDVGSTAGRESLSAVFSAGEISLFRPGPELQLLLVQSLAALPSFLPTTAFLLLGPDLNTDPENLSLTNPQPDQSSVAKGQQQRDGCWYPGMSSTAAAQAQGKRRCHSPEP